MAQQYRFDIYRCLLVNGRITRNFVVLFLLLALAGCDYFWPRHKQVEFSGWVVTQIGQPVSDAQVSVNGQVVKTKSDGSYIVALSAQETYILSITHTDYADFVHVTRQALSAKVWTLVKAQIFEIDPTTPVSITDTRPELDRKGLEGATFSLPANALVDPQGNPPTGPLRAAIATLDLTNGEGPGDWAVRSDDGREGFLVSYGAVYIEFTDPVSNVKYQLKNGVSGQLALPVLPTMSAHVDKAPSPPFWYYDVNDGYWKKAGQASFDASTNSYTGTVNHLSTINTDIAKFDNAACLAITVDASLPTGNKLRIRYHSGGTPFGQVPTFVMNDALNAAYRLPANTNVLLEMLNASDEVLSNMVVEDPVGTPTVNNVVNTGTAIPSGDSLWPPSPYTPCKPVTLRMASPEVEIRINETTAAISLIDNPTDDYITWAPTFALARLATPMGADVNVVLTNDAPNIGGNIRFAANQSPWPVNTTATAVNLALTLPADGSWVQFAIAGEFGTPSINDKDAIIEAHQDTAGGTQIGSKALMVRIRKNANNLTVGERDRFLFAWQKFRNNIAGVNYIQIQEMHRLATAAGDEAHMQPAFLSWHRAFLLLVERELQKYEPTVALHYWNWDTAAPNIFTADFMGASTGAGGFGIAEPIFSSTNPLRGWDTDLPFSGGELRRNEQDLTRDPLFAMKPLDHAIEPSLMAQTDYGPTTPGFFAVNSFSDDVEKESHNTGHGWPCAGGHLINPSRSAADPIFFLLHSQIDREWAYWQRGHDRMGVESGGVLTFPAPGHYDNNGNWNSPSNTADADFRQQGSFLEDGLWPWDGTSGGTPGTPEWRPPNQATSGGTNVPNSTPLIPGSSFPASERANLWPPIDAVPLNRHMIDFHGRFRPQDGLGFSYDDVSY
ncbi:hypothetical protein MNBD_GAMMA21-2336 [hydrothermal vent metagenome]|uniref:Tyrosinase copper-binding domain-containing protein n=1 Tax=hydrothermal vent metagenome TaxID=652676 RepID=A0A3B1A6T7_9ZZZZ